MLDTEHEKIQRGCGLAIALMKTLQMSDDKIIRKMINNCDENIKQHGVLSLGMAFAGSVNTEIIYELLTYINDTSEDVKRSAVIAIGFVCCSDPYNLITIIEPLISNYSPGVRSTAALTLGLFCCSMGNPKAIELIEVLLYDTDYLVRQSACIGIGLAMNQLTDKLCRRINLNYRRIVERVSFLILDKQDNNATAIGAVLGRSLMEAGGRNAVFSIKNNCGMLCKRRLGFALLFSQYWYDYALFAFLGLLVTPSFNVVLDKSTLELVTHPPIDNLMQDFSLKETNTASNVFSNLNSTSITSSFQNLTTSDNHNTAENVQNRGFVDSIYDTPKFEADPYINMVEAEMKQSLASRFNNPFDKNLPLVKCYGSIDDHLEEVQKMPEIKTKKRRRLRRRYKIIEEKEIIREDEVEEKEVALESERNYIIGFNERLSLIELDESDRSDFCFKFI
ncbi:hypothetical protein EDEG_00680 [Edhazardia aedis USNM 41457]|uniref:Uncharacterized protein n=1 Tax=Edhazardia aedis (strain USNM 41457) TaxID=1003232 RepID=J9DRM3_EDHAE|nr:hypothetical protein EDEG_00680 [Edhazardia aedis USNM 41457]|eukprot:EJW05215.1 hypothetical protein EDEG_00680 [Edhazardia aedis USNM 41457]